MALFRNTLPFIGILSWALLNSAALAAPDAKLARIHMQYEPSSLDPHKALEDLLVLNLFEGLTIYSATDTVVPGMATSWEASADGLVWTFHLRDASWSDGMPVTAEDFVYSLRRALDPKTAGPYTSVLSPIAYADEINAGREKDPTKLGIKALDPHTLSFTLTHPTPWFPALLVSQAAMPVPRQAVEKWGDQWTSAEHMVTNGPFILKKWVPLGELDLVRNPHFHDSALVKIDEVDHVYADDSATTLKRYEAGEIDTARVLGRDLPRIKRERPTELRSVQQLASIYVMFNMSGPLGTDTRIRQALAMTIDRDVLENSIVRNDNTPGYTFVPPGFSGYMPQRPEWADLPMADRIAKARKLLADAGVPKPLKLHVLAYKLDFAELYAKAIGEMWHAALGVETEMETSERRVVDSRLVHHDFEITLSGWTADYPDPVGFLNIFRADAAGLNFPNYENADYDALLDRSRIEIDPARRLRLLEAAEKLMLNEQPIIPLAYTVNQTLVSPRLHGWEDAPLARHPDRFLSIDESGD